jgi:tripartite-type tricarboxylate transporter receptor subunit TctC
MQLHNVARRLTTLTAIAVTIFLVGQGAAAQTFPTKAVTIVSSGAAGGGGDLVARTFADELSRRWKQPVIVENRSGIAAPVAAAAAPADGYTLYLSNDTIVTNQIVLRNPPPEPAKIWAPISLIAMIDFALIVPAGSKFKSAQEVIAAAKAAPGKLNYSSAGQSTPHHLIGELFKYQAGIDVLHIPYRGSPQAATAVVSGRADYGFQSISAIAGQVKSGQVRWLASTSEKRNSATPDLPTLNESALPDFLAHSWWAFQVRAEVPKEIQNQINQAVIETAKEPAVHKRLLDLGLEPVGSTPAEYAQFIQQDLARWRKIPDGIFAKQD